MTSENVEKVHLPSRWCLTVQQSAGEEKRSPVFISKEHEYELEGSRGKAK